MASLNTVSSLEKTVKKISSLNIDIWPGFIIAQPFPVSVLEPSVKMGVVCDRFVELAVSSFASSLGCCGS
jgi:hypothetical protein